MSTTIRDFGHSSERYGDIAFYYAFPVKFWFGQSQIAPHDVQTWCRENCTGFYKIVCYTHEDSVRNHDGSYEDKQIFVDKIYLSDEGDAAMIKLVFDVRDQKVKRPRVARKNTRKVLVKNVSVATISSGSTVDAVNTMAASKVKTKRAKKGEQLSFGF